MSSYRSGTIVWIPFVCSALPDNFAAFGMTASAFNAMSCVFSFDVCLRSSFNVGCQALKAKLESAGATLMTPTSGLRLAQSTKNF